MGVEVAVVNGPCEGVELIEDLSQLDQHVDLAAQVQTFLAPVDALRLVDQLVEAD